MAKQWRYGQKSNRRRISVELPPMPFREGQEVTIKAGAESHYGKQFSEDTKGRLTKDYAGVPYYFAVRLDAKIVVLIPREFVEVHQ